MRVLAICEELGIELRKSEPGNKAYHLYNKLCTEYKNEIHIFMDLVNKNYVQLHFNAPSYVEKILKHNQNIEHKYLRDNVNNALNIPELHEFVEANKPIAELVEKLSLSSFSNAVKYNPPTNINVSPATIRLMNNLSFECQRTDLIHNLRKAYTSDSHFNDTITAYNKEKASAPPSIPLSKPDRAIVKELIRKGHKINNVNIVHSLMNAITFIKCTIYDSFYGTLFEVFEESEVISRQDKILGSAHVIKLKLAMSVKLLHPNSGWILKLHNKDGTIIFCQIFKKIFKFGTNFEEEEYVITVVELTKL